MKTNIEPKICCIPTLLHSCIHTLTVGANAIGNSVALYVTLVTLHQAGFAER